MQFPGVKALLTRRGTNRIQRLVHEQMLVTRNKVTRREFFLQMG